MRSIAKKVAPALALALALTGAAQAATAVTTTPVNLRRAPNGAVLHIIPDGTLLTVACQKGWCRTSYQGRGGYVASAFLKNVTKSAPLAGQGVKFYASCADMRAAGAAPIRIGKPGYRTGLDRDGDGWACRYDRLR